MIQVKKFRLLIAFISLLVCMTFIQETYAKYVSNVDGSANMTIARWKILVNTEDISEGILTSNTITPVFAGDSNIKANTIAPTSTGYFDIVIDASNTDVTFNYTINALPSLTSNVTDLVTTGYSIDGGETITFTTYNTDITGTINYGTIDPVTIRVFVMWNDGDSSTMNNSADTDASTGIDTNATMDVSLSFIQNH